MKKRTLKQGLLKWSFMASTCIATLGAQAQTTGTVYVIARNATETQLYRLVNPGTPGVQAIAIGSPSTIPYQTIAYYNGDLYGTVSNQGTANPGSQQVGTPNIVKINPTTGVATFIAAMFPAPGPVSGSYLQYGNYESCEVANGILYVNMFSAWPWGGGNRQLYTVNLTTGATTTSTVGVGYGDFVYYNGYLYAGGGAAAGSNPPPNISGTGNLVRIDPNTGHGEVFGPGALTVPIATACWKDANNVMYFNKVSTYNPTTNTVTEDANVGSGSLTTVYGDFVDGTWSPNVVAPTTYPVSGNIFDDGNGGTIDGTGTNAGGTLYVVLTNGSGTIVGSSPVAANGTYSINAPAGTYSAILTTSPTSTTPVLPTGWANTNEGLTAAGDGTVNGTIPNINVAGSVNGANFGIDQLPTAGTSSTTATNPGGTGTIDITPNFTGTDPDGTVTQIHFTTFPTNTSSIIIGGTVYTAANWPATGVTVPTGTTILLDPVDGTSAPVVPYKVIDNAGKESTNPGSVTVNLTAPVTYTVSGNVYDDGNGGTIDGIGTNAGGTLYVLLVNATGTIMYQSTVSANGTYSHNVPAGTYTVILTTSPPNTTPTLPAGWVNTNEGSTIAGDGTANGSIPAVNVTDNVSGINFGIDQLPTAGTSSITAANPGGTGTINITPNFTGTDPDGTVTQIHFTTFPTNTTSITIGGTTYTAANWPATGVTVPTGTAVLLDPTGTGNPVAPYKVIDNAGKESTNPGSVTVNLTAPGATPDLTPSLDIDNLSFPVAGAPRDFVVNVFEINGGTAVNPITIRLAKLSAFTITYPTESSTSNVYGGIANENSNWDITENASFITITAKAGVTIPANGAAVLGFTIARKPGVINGTTQNLTTTIIGGSGGETNTTNNKTLTSFTASPN